MSITSALARGQAAAEARMLDNCTIRRKTGQTRDPVTLAMVPTYATIYTGKCDVQLKDTVATRPGAGEHEWTITRTITKVPMSVVGLKVDDEVVMNTSQDADLVGKVLRVRSVFHKTHATARRLECEETQA